MILGNPSIGQIFVAEKEGKVIGMASLLFTISTALGGKVGILEDVIVTPEFRGQGIGKQLINQILKYSRRMKLKRLTLLTDGDNHIAQDLYKHFGFRSSKMLPMRLSLS
jgi:GNAT superfamily N-acetyltransferase